MIRLKSLLLEQTSDTRTIPKVLFIGDSSLNRSWSYAQRLIDNELVDADISTEKSPTLDDLLQLLRSNINNNYNVISISLFNINKSELSKQAVSQFIRKLTDILEIAKSYGANVILIPPITKTVPDVLMNWILKQNIADSVLQLDNDDNIRRVNIKLKSSWIRVVNDLFKSNTSIKINDTPSDETIDTSLSNKLKSSSTINKKSKLQTKTNKFNKNKEKSDIDSVKSSALGAGVLAAKIGNSINANFSDSIVNQAYDIILPFEGFTPIAKKDSDGYCRIGHGSSHITKEDGTIITLGKPAGGKSCAETYTYNISETDAHRDLRRLISDVFIPLVTKKIKQWGGDMSKFNDATIATLVSVAYNYGHIPDKLKPGIEASDPEAIGNTLLTQFNSSGSNPKRRKKEGQYILDSLSTNSTEDEEPSLFQRAWNSIKNMLEPNEKIDNIKPHVGKLSYTSGFGPRWGKFHYGIDYSLGVGTPIYMVTPGEIVRADGRNVTGYGNVIYVKHDDGVVTRYGHMSRMDVSVGQRVEFGDMIGLTGGKKNAPGAGNSTGPHLHWEYIVNGKHVDGLSQAENYFSTHPLEKPEPTTPNELSSMNSRLNNSLWSVDPIK